MKKCFFLLFFIFVYGDPVSLDWERDKPKTPQEPALSEEEKEELLEEEEEPEEKCNECSLNTEKKKNSSCDISNFGSVSFFHREGGGIGYNQGYSTIDAFWPPLIDSNAFPYCDFRFEVTNHAKLAANLGLGVRHRPDNFSWAYGFFGYYDLRRSQERTFHRFGAGWEWFYPKGTFTLNGYLPFGKTKRNHDKLLSLWGLDLLWEHRLYTYKSFYLESALGPYYFQRKKGAFGGKVGLNLGAFKYLLFSGTLTMDRLFHTHVEGMAALQIPFGSSLKKKKGGDSFDLCSADKALVQRMRNIPRRQELIVLSHR